MFSKIGSFDRLLDFPGLKLDLKSIDIAIALLGYAIFHYCINRTVKGPRMWPLLGMLPSLLLHLNNTYDWVTKILKDCGGTFVFKGPLMSNLNCVVTADPANLEYMLKLRFNNFPKGEYFRTLAHDFLGDGIFNADAEVWKRQRRTANVEFNTASFKAFMISSVQELVKGRLVPLLQNVTRSRATFDLQELLLQFTFDNVCMVALGVDPGCLGGSRPEAQAFAKAFEDATEATMLRFLMPTALWRFMHFLHIGSEQNLWASLMTVNRFIDDTIKTRNESLDLPPGQALNGSADLLQGRTDLLTAFMKVKTETGAPVFTDKMLRSISINFILAGRDTSSVALSWFFWLLLRHPEVEERVLAETRAILSKRPSVSLHAADLNFTVEELKQMHYLQAALSESLRLYPSVPVDQKEVDSDDCLPDGTHLKKGTKIIYSIYSMGRMESIWGKDCMEFRPERWLDKGGNFVSESAFKYPVFNGGPRLCLGKDFAYYQMKWIAATIIWGFEMKMVAGHVVEPKLALTLYMKKWSARHIAAKGSSSSLVLYH